MPATAYKMPLSGCSHYALKKRIDLWVFHSPSFSGINALHAERLYLNIHLVNMKGD